MVRCTDAGLQFTLRQPGILRELAASELSDGTMRFLLLATALLTPRPPALMVLNEPESSLHPDLIAPLGRLILEAARNSQLIVVTHNPQLVIELQSDPECNVIRLNKSLGETAVEDLDELYQAGWKWPSR
jgi:predicted ATPase